MNQDHFSSIAAGNLPLLAFTLFPERNIPHFTIPRITLPASHCAPVSQDIAYVHWTALLARIAHMARLCAQPHIAQYLSALGVRRTRTVVIDLAREYVYAWDVTGANGLLLSATEVMRITQSLPVSNHLAEEFGALAENYRFLLRTIAPRGGDALFRWLSERASVHIAQAQAVQSSD